jgi:hypothetical protein
LNFPRGRGSALFLEPRALLEERLGFFAAACFNEQTSQSIQGAGIGRIEFDRLAESGFCL